MGLATARNNAISASNGKYIIPLDADNKLHANYLTTAIDLLEKKEDIDVVYGNSVFFGDKYYYNEVEKFDICKIFQFNYIDACAVIRKRMLDKTAGYDVNMPGHGHEDWELWINIFFQGGKFFHLNDIGFYYRVTSNSMRLNISSLTPVEDKEYIVKKNAFFLLDFYNTNYWKIKYLKTRKLKGALSILLGRMF